MRAILGKCRRWIHRVCRQYFFLASDAPALLLSRQTKKMASPQEKAQIVLWYAEHKSVVKVQRMFRRVYKRNSPQTKSIKKWHKTFLETGSVQKRSGGDRRSHSDARVEEVWAKKLSFRGSLGGFFFINCSKHSLHFYYGFVFCIPQNNLCLLLR